FLGSRAHPRLLACAGAGPGGSELRALRRLHREYEGPYMLTRPFMFAALSGESLPAGQPARAIRPSPWRPRKRSVREKPALPAVGASRRLAREMQQPTGDS